MEPGPYRIDVSYDDEPIIRVRYTLSADGWLQWIGGFKEDGDGRWVGVSIASVRNLVTDGCHNHAPADPPVGGTVDDLATALATLAPFEVLEQPRDVTAYGYSGRYLRLMVPSDIPFETVEGTRFTECFQGLLKSWIEPLSDAFYGYAAPGHVEEFWILDIDGRRLVIEANWFEDSPPEHLAEMRSVLDSIEIQPLRIGLAPFTGVAGVLSTPVEPRYEDPIVPLLRGRVEGSGGRTPNRRQYLPSQARRS